jgi:uncharacterized protein (TIGR03067 family)
MSARLLSTFAALLAVAAPALAFPPVPPPRPKKIDQKALDGTWKVVSYAYSSGKVTRTLRLYPTVEIKDGQWVQHPAARAGGRPPTYTIKIDGSKSPPTIDMSSDASRVGPRRGVFRLDGQKLIVTYVLSPKARPAKVDGDLADGQYRWVLEREKQ